MPTVAAGVVTPSLGAGLLTPGPAGVPLALIPEDEPPWWPPYWYPGDGALELGGFGGL